MTADQEVAYGAHLPLIDLERFRERVAALI
jgi:hypothetical protein